MGWFGDYSWHSVSDVKDSLIKDMSAGPAKVLANRLIGQKLWVAVERETGERYITLYLIRSSKGEFMYKGLDEHMGPYEFDCPLSLLAMTEEKRTKSEYGDNWREKVRAFHANKSRTFQVGQKVTIGGRPYAIVGKHKAGWLVDNVEGNRFWAATKDIDLAEQN